MNRCRKKSKNLWQRKLYHARQKILPSLNLWMKNSIESSAFSSWRVSRATPSSSSPARRRKMHPCSILSMSVSSATLRILLRDPLTASYFVTVWKMLRKQGCVPSALTQNVKDLLASREIENILDNTDFMILLSQAQSDRAILAKQIGISEHQLSYITQSNSGEGLLFYGSVTIPFVDRFPRGEIYDLLTTKPEDAANGKQTE